MPNFDWRGLLVSLASGGTVPPQTIQRWKDWLSQMELSGNIASLSPIALESLIKAGIDPREDPALQRRHLQEYLQTQTEQRAAEEEAKRQQGLVEEQMQRSTSRPAFPTTTPQEGYRWVYSPQLNDYVQEPIPYQAPAQAEPEPRQALDYQAWLNYRNRGGNLSLEEWVAQGYPSPPSKEISPYEQAGLGYQQEQLDEQIRQFNLQQDFMKQQLAAESQRQSQMIDWYREQEQIQQEAQRQTQLANLRANPESWLEYASLAGETPVVQPWMVPLSPPGMPLSPGQGLPGWTTQGESLQSLPELKTPSAQYIARIPPSARAQYGGYEQARTGARPEDVNWLLSSTVAPPGGGGGGRLRWLR